MMTSHTVPVAIYPVFPARTSLGPRNRRAIEIFPAGFPHPDLTGFYIAVC
jgi:hypothetical protein